MERKRNIFSLFFLVLCSLFAKAQVSEQHLKQHIELLASDSLQGRLVGTVGEKMEADYIQSQFETWKLRPLFNDSFFQDFSFTYQANPHTSPQLSDSITGRNVLAFLDNNASYTFIIGAHYDHLGHNEYNLSSEVNGTGQIHNGADDNASGVSAVLELARIYSQNEEQEPVNFIFACFSGEEEGLMGSKYLAEKIKKKYPKASCMFNFDMIGRMDSLNNLYVGGVGTAPQFRSVLENKKPANLQLVIDSSGVGPSDHSSFYYQEIPVLFFFTGLHSDYHKPSDDAEKINYNKIFTIISYTKEIVDSLSNSPDLAFTPTKVKAKKESPAYKISLGIFPDYKDYGDGLHIQDVIAHKTAEKYGLKRGDIITKIGKQDVTDIYSYMEALSKLEANKKYTIHFLRDQKAKKLKIKF